MSDAVLERQVALRLAHEQRRHRIEEIYRRMCRKAGIDPDTVVLASAASVISTPWGDRVQVSDVNTVPVWWTYGRAAELVLEEVAAQLDGGHK